jgi:hypothetical protein
MLGLRPRRIDEYEPRLNPARGPPSLYDRRAVGVRFPHFACFVIIAKPDDP